MSSEISVVEDGLAYICSQLNARIKSFRASAAWYRRRYYASTMSTIVLSGIITIIAGWKPDVGMYFSNVILALGVLSTFISAWGAFFSPKESWLLYAKTLNKLQAFKARLEFVSKQVNRGMHDPALTDAFFNDYQRILDEHNTAWLEIRAFSKSETHQRQRDSSMKVD